MDLTQYKLIRSGRKTLALYLTPHGLEVRAPFVVPKSEIDRFVRSKRSWIEKHLPEMDSPEDAAPGFKRGYGDRISFRGEDCPIVGSPSMKATKPGYMKGHFADGAFTITEDLSPSDIRFVLSRIFRDEAEQHLPQRVRHYGALMGLSPDSVRITSAFGRWGSCSARKRLNFAWMLMMADDDAIDSVVVHELAHMIHSNHSAEFYKTVRRYCPDYDRQHKKLVELGTRVRREGWNA